MVKEALQKAGKAVGKIVKTKVVPIVAPIGILAVCIVSLFVGATETSSSDGYSSVDGFYGESVQEKVWWALKDQGFSNCQVAAAMGNIHCESDGFEPSRVEYGYDENNGGIGLCQWTNSDRGSQGNNTNLKNYAKSKGTTWQDEDTQIEFLITYLTGKGKATEYTSNAHMGRTYFNTYYEATAWEKYKETGKSDNDIDYLTRAFLANYEGPGSQYADSSISNRIQWAKKYYDEFKGKKKPQGGSESSSNTAGIKGYYKSSSGKTYTEYYQNVEGTSWYATDGCFHCSIATIISGFGSNKTPNQLTGFSYGSGCYGNKVDFTNAGCKYEQISSSEVKSALKKGDPIMIHIAGNTLTTDNGSHYFGGHWLSMLDYKKENGKDKVYIHDPWKGDPCWGWGDLDTVNKAIVEFWHVWK